MAVPGCFFDGKRLCFSKDHFPPKVVPLHTKPTNLTNLFFFFPFSYQWKNEWDLTSGPRSVSCDRAIIYSGLGVRSVGPTVGDFLEQINTKKPYISWLHQLMKKSVHVSSAYSVHPIALAYVPIESYRTHWTSFFFGGGLSFRGGQVFQHIFCAPFGYKRYPLKNLP